MPFVPEAMTIEAGAEEDQEGSWLSSALLPLAGDPF